MTFEEWWEQNKRSLNDSGVGILELIQTAWNAGRADGMDRAADVAQEIAGDDGDWECGAIAASNRIRFEAGTLHVAS